MSEQDPLELARRVKHQAAYGCEQCRADLLTLARALLGMAATALHHQTKRKEAEQERDELRAALERFSNCHNADACPCHIEAERLLNRLQPARTALRGEPEPDPAAGDPRL